MVVVINVMLIGLMAGGGWYSRNITPDRADNRTFGAFLQGQVETATGTISGHEALLQIAGMPVILGIGGSIIVMLAVLTGVGG